MTDDELMKAIRRKHELVEMLMAGPLSLDLEVELETLERDLGPIDVVGFLLTKIDELEEDVEDAYRHPMGF